MEFNLWLNDVFNWIQNHSTLIFFSILFICYIIAKMVGSNVDSPDSNYDWQKSYRSALGKYFGIKEEEAETANIFDGKCKFDEKPLDVNIRLPKDEKVYAAFHNLDLMKNKRDGRIAAQGFTLRVKIIKGLYYRAGAGRYGAGKSWQSVSNGTLYITNKGILFDGSIENIKLPWSKILKEDIDSDSVIIQKPNGPLVVFKGKIDPAEAAKFTIVSKMNESL